MDPPPCASESKECQSVWKFGYGSNMSAEFLRTSKGLNPLASLQTVLPGFRLSFPQGMGIEFVEPSFASLKRDPDGEVHGVSTLLPNADAAKLDEQEAGGYTTEVMHARVYDTGEMLAVEVYVRRKPLALDHPEGPCSMRYRNILVRGAEESGLDAKWIAKLRALPTYTPSAEVLALRAAVPSPSALPLMSIAELRQRDGSSEELGCYTAACGYIFNHKPHFDSYRGRDITKRNILHYRGINLEANDDGGVSPFPRLSQLPGEELEYALQNLDRLLHKAGMPVAVLREFWDEQDVGSDGVFRGELVEPFVTGSSR
eukprot:NODE_15636_length_1039_cov_4.640351.p1 GENE.NODE_15636_length_1039_cov_4.640351~~NODE_15636_length_1039_cov_4.640351.p1  ORF type:complete len:315 (-),score=56.04 NODE_15636_length_1039_cov_4.640351:64-1008(-)